MTEENKSNSVVSLMEYPFMPALWDGEDEGGTFECGDYICIFEKAPRPLLIVSKERKMFPKDFGNDAIKFWKKTGIKYHYALLCFWKKGRNPDGFDSARPAKVYTIETSDIGSQTPMLCAFTPSGRVNMGKLARPYTTMRCLKAMLFEVSEGHLEEVHELGTKAVGFALLTGKRYAPPRRKKHFPKMEPSSPEEIVLLIVFAALIAIGLLCG